MRIDIMPADPVGRRAPNAGAERAQTAVFRVPESERPAPTTPMAASPEKAAVRPSDRSDARGHAAESGEDAPSPQAEQAPAPSAIDEAMLETDALATAASPTTAFQAAFRPGASTEETAAASGSGEEPDATTRASAAPDDGASEPAAETHDAALPAALSPAAPPVPHSASADATRHGAIVSTLARASAPGRGGATPGDVGAIVSAAARTTPPQADDTQAQANGTPPEANGKQPLADGKQPRPDVTLLRANGAQPVGIDASAVGSAIETDAEPLPQALRTALASLEDATGGANGKAGAAEGEDATGARGSNASQGAASPSGAAPPSAAQAQNAPQAPPAELARPPGHASGPAPQVASPQTASAPPPPGLPVLEDVPLGAVPIAIGMRSLAGASRFEIRLDPPELGRIAVSLSIEDGEVSARLVVDRVETLQLLSRDAKTLERAFEQAGLKAGENAVQISLRETPGAGERRESGFAQHFGRDGDGQGRSGREEREGRNGETRDRLELIEASGGTVLRGAVRAVDLRI